MKKSILGLALAATSACLGVAAQPNLFGDTAKVLSATPIYDHVAYPRRDCRTEPTRGYEERIRRDEYRPARNDGIGPGAILGAIVGGVIGHQFGNSTGGRDHGTAAGAVIGGLVGNSIEKDAGSASRDAYVERVPVTRDVERCETIADARETIVGYEVRYEYAGRQFTTRMPFDPGPQMPVNVEVRPPHVRDSIIGPRPPNYRGPF